MAVLTTGRATAPTRSPATSPPKHLAEKILTSRNALEDELELPEKYRGESVPIYEVPEA